jgi:hypothetical protein
MAEILPGEALISKGLRDLVAGRETVEALLVAVGAPRLRDLGVELPADLPANPEHRLYARLVELDPRDAYGQYNALIRRLVSFERAAECVKP